VRINNPGALNVSSWQKTRPGYVGFSDPDGSADHNVTTIYRTPEHGVASWFYLINRVYGFGTSEKFSLLQLAQRYAGRDTGAAVDAYLTGWRSASQGALGSTSIIDISDDQQMLELGRSMFTHEAGRPTPLQDAQIIFGIQNERNGTLPV
jgi:hypothetical protein